MTIQRQYFLPNCTLTVEGMSASSSQDVFRPSLDLLMRFECNFSALNQAVSGGSELLESLIRATNQCTQSWISGIQHARRRRGSESEVQLNPNETGGFQLSIPAHLLSNGDETTETPETPALNLDLTPVQLFDLAEAFDQLLSDTQTLPNLTAQIRPLPRKAALADQPLGQRATPLILGTLGLALSAGALFFLPAPEIERPETKPSLTPTNTSSPAPSGTTPPTSSPTGTPDAQESPAAKEATTPESPDKTETAPKSNTP